MAACFRPRHTGHRTSTPLRVRRPLAAACAVRCSKHGFEQSRWPHGSRSLSTATVHRQTGQEMGASALCRGAWAVLEAAVEFENYIVASPDKRWENSKVYLPH